MIMLRSTCAAAAVNSRLKGPMVALWLMHYSLADVTVTITSVLCTTQARNTDDLRLSFGFLFRLFVNGTIVVNGTNKYIITVPFTCF